MARNSGFAATTATNNELLIFVIFSKFSYFENILNEAKNRKMNLNGLWQMAIRKIMSVQPAWLFV